MGRILWSFSATYQVTYDPEYLHAAEKAYNYMMSTFIDPVYVGVYWTVTAEGKLLWPRLKPWLDF